MNNFKLNGLNITDYEGKGLPLIFIHAYPLCNRMWDEQVSYFRNKYRVITYDIRGLGYSNNLDDYLFTMEEHVNDFFSIIDHLNIEKINACGLSMGGYILLRALVRDQNRFSSVILADTKSENDDNTGLINRAAAVMKLKSESKDEFLDGFLKKLLSDEGYRNRKTREFVRTMMSWMDAKGMAANMIAIATRTNIFYQLKEIRTPALIIVGKKDELTPVINSFNLKEGLRNSTFKVINEAGHLSNLEKPEEFNKTIESFLINL